jgi:hypothetical protein
MMQRVLMRLFVAIAATVSAGGIAYVYVMPPESMRVTRNGVPHQAPPVAHPLTGEALSLEELVRHFKGERR